MQPPPRVLAELRHFFERVAVLAAQIREFRPARRDRRQALGIVLPCLFDYPKLGREVGCLGLESMGTVPQHLELSVPFEVGDDAPDPVENACGIRIQIRKGNRRSLAEHCGT